MTLHYWTRSCPLTLYPDIMWRTGEINLKLFKSNTMEPLLSTWKLLLSMVQNPPAWNQKNAAGTAAGSCQRFRTSRPQSRLNSTEMQLLKYRIVPQPSDYVTISIFSPHYLQRLIPNRSATQHTVKVTTMRSISITQQKTSPARCFPPPCSSPSPSSSSSFASSSSSCLLSP